MKKKVLATLEDRIIGELLEIGAGTEFKENKGFSDIGLKMIEIWDKALIDFENNNMIGITERRKRNNGRGFNR